MVGEPSYGKASVQSIVDLGNNTKLKYTAAQYHLPSGRTLSNKNTSKDNTGSPRGISPDIEVNLRNDELEKLYKISTSNADFDMSGHTNSKSAITASSQNFINSDRQILIALMALKAELN